MDKLHYNIDAIFNEATDSAIEGAKKIYYDGIGGGFSVTEGEGKRSYSITLGGKASKTKKSLQGTAERALDTEKNTDSREGKEPHEHCIEASITFDEEGEIFSYNCNGGCDLEENGACVHVLAAALKLSEAVFNDGSYGRAKKPFNVRLTDLSVNMLIREYTAQRNMRSLSYEGRVELEPTLYFEELGTFLRLKVGRTRKYSVKSLQEFLSACASGITVRYGVGLKFKHSEGMFSLEANQLIRFLQKCRRDRLDILQKKESAVSTFEQLDYYTEGRRRTESSPTEATRRLKKDEFLLTVRDRDEFFGIFEGKHVNLGHTDGETVRYSIQRGDSFKPLIRIERSAGGYEISLKDVTQWSAVILEGGMNCFFIAKEAVYICDRLLFERAGQLILALKKSKLFVSEEDMPLFYNNVLARCLDVLEIEAVEIATDSFTFPPLLAKLYLDEPKSEEMHNAIDDKKVVAKLVCTYGDIEVDIFANEGGATVYRDWETENALITTLKTFFPYYPSLYLADDEDVFILFKEGLEQLFNYADIFLSRELGSIEIKKPRRTPVGLRFNAGLLEVDFYNSEYSSEELDRLAAAYKNNKKYVKLFDGSFLDLSDGAGESLMDLLSLGKRQDKKILLPAFYAPLVNERLKDSLMDAQMEESYNAFLRGFESFDSLKMDFGDLDGVLRNYQKEGVRWLKMLLSSGFGGILADDMGLGKTIQLLALIWEHSLSCKERKGAVAIIICPTSLIINWAKEAARFVPSLSVLRVMGGTRERAQLIKGSENNGGVENYDIVITSYELFKRDFELYEQYDFEIAALDEAQYIKNHETQNAVAVKGIRAKYKFALTGTPIENSLSELWSIFDFLMPGYLFSYNKFRASFEAAVSRGESESTEMLKKMVRPFILRRLKADVLKELPEKIESDITIPLIAEQKEMYYKHLALVRHAMDSGELKNKIAALSMLTKLRQICCDPSLVDEDYKGNSEKLDVCMNLLRKAALGGGKTLMFSQFTSMLRIIKRRLEEEKIRFYLLEGKTSKQERNKLIERFNQDETPIFLISLRAGGTGINLTGADTVIHYDPWWNDPVMNQATDRAHRIGQTKNVQVYKLIMENSVEEKILSLRAAKSALFETFVDGEGPSITEILKQTINDVHHMSLK